MKMYMLGTSLILMSVSAFARQPIATVDGQGLVVSAQGQEQVVCGYTLYQLNQEEARKLTQNPHFDVSQMSPQLDFFIVGKDGKKRIVHRHNEITYDSSVYTSGSVLSRARSVVGLGPAPEFVNQFSFERSCSSEMQGPPPNNRCITDITLSKYKVGFGAPWTGYVNTSTIKCALNSVVNDYDPKHISLTPIIRFSLREPNEKNPPTIMDTFNYNGY